MIFSPDAMLGIAIIILLFSSITLTTWTEPKKASQKNLTYQKATDEAIWRFYTKSTDNTIPNNEDLICATIIEFSDATDDITTKVKVCK